MDQHKWKTEIIIIGVFHDLVNLLKNPQDTLHFKRHSNVDLVKR